VDNVDLMGYTKLFDSLIMSTIWRADDKTRLVFITMLALRNRNHQIMASIPGLADAAHVSVDECRQAIAKLLAPDPDSRSKDLDGARIVEVDGGWELVNGEKYRQLMSADERREYLKIKQRES